MIVKLLQKIKNFNKYVLYFIFEFFIVNGYLILLSFHHDLYFFNGFFGILFACAGLPILIYGD